MFLENVCDSSTRRKREMSFQNSQKASEPVNMYKNVKIQSFHEKKILSLRGESKKKKCIYYIR